MSQPRKQRSIPALYMRGGTSKGVFLNPDDLPADPAERDALLLRLMDSLDPYRQQLDGMGAATSSTRPDGWGPSFEARYKNKKRIAFGQDFSFPRRCAVNNARTSV